MARSQCRDAGAQRGAAPERRRFGGCSSRSLPGELEVSCRRSERGPHDDVAAELSAADPRVSIVDNPAARTPSALNVGIQAARFDIIVRVDGHGELTDGYIARAVELLAETGAANVGGVMAAGVRRPSSRRSPPRTPPGSDSVAPRFIWPSHRPGGGDRLSRCIPEGGAAGARRLRREHAPGAGLGAELSAAQERPADLVLAGPPVTYRPRSSFPR